MQSGVFLFEQYRFDAAASALHLHYRYEDGPAFEEIIAFPPSAREPAAEDQKALDGAFRLIFLLAGVSYYKAYVPPQLKCAAFDLDPATASFVEKVYRNGLGEFSFENKLDLRDRVHFAAGQGKAPAPASPVLQHRLCVPVGGGKDSILTLEYLKRAGQPATLFALGTSTGIAEPIRATIEASGLPFVKVERTLSPNLFELNKAGAYNGHVPITAILSAIAVACALMQGWDTVVMSNEHSADAPNLRYNDLEINHQYSKSFAFEQDFSRYISEHVAAGFSYFSLLRPLSETAIARRFARLEKYHGVFRSCNTAFRQDAARRGKGWCCNCPKCRFVFLALASFLPKQGLTAIFGKNLLDDPAQKEGFAALCGLADHKPFECVGEIDESALLMEKLYRSPEWKADRVVSELGARLVNQRRDFDGAWQALFALQSGHQLPAGYREMLNADF